MTMPDHQPEQRLADAEEAHRITLRRLDAVERALEGIERERDQERERVAELEAENARWLEWSCGNYPDGSPGDVIQAYSDGTIILDDGVTTWNPLRALAWTERRCDALASAGGDQDQEEDK